MTELKSRIGRSCLLPHFLGKTRSHARHAARSTALVQTWMDQSETLLLFFAKTNLRQSCSRVSQSSWSLSPLQAQKSSRSRLMDTVYQIFLPMVLRCVCFARARGLRYKTIKHATSPKLPPWVAWKGKNQNFQRILRAIFKKRNVTQMRV